MNDKKFKSVSDIDKNIISYKNKIFKIQRKILALNKNSDVDFSLDDFKSFLLSKKAEQKISANLKKNPRKPVQNFSEISTDCSLAKEANLV